MLAFVGLALQDNRIKRRFQPSSRNQENQDNDLECIAEAYCRMGELALQKQVSSSV